MGAININAPMCRVLYGGKRQRASKAAAVEPRDAVRPLAGVHAGPFLRAITQWRSGLKSENGRVSRGTNDADWWTRDQEGTNRRVGHHCGLAKITGDHNHHILLPIWFAVGLHPTVTVAVGESRREFC